MLEVKAMTACGSQHQALAQHKADLDNAKRLYETAATLALKNGIGFESHWIPLRLAS